jgi:hypothetical protein
VRRRCISNHNLWRRIRERYQRRRGLCRPLALLLRRAGVPAPVGVMRKNGRSNVWLYQVALHLHLSSPVWLPGSTRWLTPREPVGHRTVLRTRVNRAREVAGRPMRTSGSAPSADGAIRAWFETPSARGPSAFALSSDRPSARAVPSTTSSSNGTSTPASGRPNVFRPGMWPSSLWHARSRGEGDGGAHETIPARATPRASGHAVPRVDFEERTFVHSAQLPVPAGNSDRRDKHGPPRRRSALAGSGSAEFQPVLRATLPPRRVQQRGEGTRPSLYAQAVPRSFQNHHQVGAHRMPEPDQRAAVPPRRQAPTTSPQIDLGRLSEDVYQHIQRKIRIERERRGL